MNFLINKYNNVNKTKLINNKDSKTKLTNNKDSKTKGRYAYKFFGILKV